MVDNNKRIQELQGLKQRLETDLSRVRFMGGELDRNAPLQRNYKNVVSELNSLKKDGDK